jgi:hypothetical protein
MSAVVMGVVFAFSGCASANPTENDPAEVGTYTLVSVNGTAVPVTTIQNSTQTTEILSGTFVVNRNHTFEETRVGRLTLAGGTPQTINSSQTGTWEAATGQIHFNALNSSQTVVASWSATYSANTLTYTYQGATFAYKKNEMALAAP